MKKVLVAEILMFILASLLFFRPASVHSDATANTTAVSSSLLASVKDYGELVFGPAQWNSWTLLTFGVGSKWGWTYPSEGSIIGDELTNHWWSGSTGTFDFTVLNEPDFNDVAAFLTNGENDYIWLTTVCGDSTAGQGTSEQWWGIGDPDLAGFKIDFIRLRVYSLSVSWLSTPFGTDTSVKHNATWEIWGSSLRLEATVSIFPSALNLGSKGRWITAYIELPEGLNATDIDVSSVKINKTIPAEMKPWGIGDHDGDGVPELMVKFNRAAVVSLIINSTGHSSRFAKATLTITGKLKDGTPFQASDTIKIISATSRYGRLQRLEFLEMEPLAGKG